MSSSREVAVLVHREREALVLLRALGDPYWHVVAGGVEEGESYEQAAERELREETGLDRSGKVHPLRHRYVYLHPRRGEIAVESFAVEASACWEPELNEEHSEYRWCSFAEAVATVRWPGTKESLELLESRLPGRRRRGFTLRRPRESAVFFLRLPGEEAADEVAKVLAADGYTVRLVEEPAHWLVEARGEVRVDSLEVAEHALTELARVSGGVFAGYRLDAG